MVGHSAEPVRQGDGISAEQDAAWRAFLTGAAHLGHTLNRTLDEACALTHTEYAVLALLQESPHGTLRMSALAELLVLSRSRVTHTIKRLEARRLVLRVSCPSDGRGIDCVLTALGAETFETALPAHVGVLRRHVVDLLSDEELALLGRAMERVGASCRERSPG